MQIHMIQAYQDGDKIILDTCETSKGDFKCWNPASAFYPQFRSCSRQIWSIGRCTPPLELIFRWSTLILLESNMITSGLLAWETLWRTGSITRKYLPKKDLSGERSVVNATFSLLKLSKFRLATRLLNRSLSPALAPSPKLTAFYCPWCPLLKGTLIFVPLCWFLNLWKWQK